MFLLFSICFFGKIICLDNGLGRTPQMGWNSWNKFACKISEKLIIDTINELNESGLKEAGYKYINIDDCWQRSRHQNGTIIPDRIAFPNGIKPLVDYAHSKGLKFGIYSDAGYYTCERRPGSLGYEEIDAQTYADWGVDYLKYDNCFKGHIKSIERYEKMREALKKTGKKIFYSICNWGEEEVYKWGKEVGNSWRTTKDIKDNWKSMIRIIDINNKYYNYSGPGGWNDPDMLEVGNGGMTNEEYKTHFGLWAISKAPLLIGCDITKINKEIKDILTNPEVIAINQDSLGIQGRKIKHTKIDYPSDDKYILGPKEIEIAECNGRKGQKWYINEDGSIRNNNENLCIEIPSCSKNSVQLRTNRCHIDDKFQCGKSKNQMWKYDKEKKKIYSELFPDKCIHILDLDYLNVQSRNCQDIDNQKWEYNEDDHTFRSMGKCLTIYMNEEATEVWAGRLSDNSYAILLLNKGSFKNNIEITWEEIGFNSVKAKIRDLWERKDLGIYNYNYSMSIESHSSQLLKIIPLNEDTGLEKESVVEYLHENKSIFEIMIFYICLIILILVILILGFIIYKKTKRKGRNKYSKYPDEFIKVKIKEDKSSLKNDNC